MLDVPPLTHTRSSMTRRFAEPSLLGVQAAFCFLLFGLLLGFVVVWTCFAAPRPSTPNRHKSLTISPPSYTLDASLLSVGS